MSDGDLEPVVDSLEELFVFSTLLGRWLAWESVPSAQGIREQRAALLATDEALVTLEKGSVPILSGLSRAIDWLRSRVSVTRAYLGRMKEVARSRAFSVAGLFRKAFVEEVKESLAISLQKGDTLEQWSNETLTKIPGTSGIGSAHAETIYRTVYQSTRQAAMLEEYEDPDLAEWISGYQYLTMDDDRVSDICRPLHRKKFRADDPAIRLWWPPNHYNCRCMFLPIDRLEAKGTKFHDGEIEGQPADGFEGPPSALA